MKFLKTSGVCFMLIACLLVLAPSTARAVDAVLVGEDLRVIDLTHQVKNIAPMRYEFALQNTSKAPIGFDIIISGRDIFHDAILGKKQDILITAPLRLIASDDAEAISTPRALRQIRVALKAGELKRFVLIGDIDTSSSFWVWHAPFRQDILDNNKRFQMILLIGLGVLALGGLPILFYQRRKRLALPALVSGLLIFLMGLRWDIFPNWLSGGADSLLMLRLTMLAFILVVLFGHRTLLRMPWVERRYWRSVVLIADIIFIAALMGWVILYFSPSFLGIATVEVLELALFLAPASLCLAVIMSYRRSKRISKLVSNLVFKLPPKLPPKLSQNTNSVSQD